MSVAVVFANIREFINSSSSASSEVARSGLLPFLHGMNETESFSAAATSSSSLRKVSVIVGLVIGLLQQPPLHHLAPRAQCHSAPIYKPSPI